MKCTAYSAAVHTSYCHRYDHDEDSDPTRTTPAYHISSLYKTFCSKFSYRSANRFYFIFVRPTRCSPDWIYCSLMPLTFNYTWSSLQKLLWVRTNEDQAQSKSKNFMFNNCLCAWQWPSSITTERTLAERVLKQPLIENKNAVGFHDPTLVQSHVDEVRLSARISRWTSAWKVGVTPCKFLFANLPLLTPWPASYLTWLHSSKDSHSFKRVVSRSATLSEI